jgi:hypothetical protein
VIRSPMGKRAFLFSVAPRQALGPNQPPIQWVPGAPFNPLIEDYTEIFYMTDEGDVPSVQYKMSLRGPKPMRTVDDLSLIFIDLSRWSFLYILSMDCIENTASKSSLLLPVYSLRRPHVYRVVA